MAAILTSDEDVGRLLGSTHTIAIIGASPKRDRPSFGVMAALKSAGYKLFPVNPGVAGQTILGEPVFATLAEIAQPIDMVDVFRRPEDTPAVAREAVAAGAKSLWLQLDIVNDEAARIAVEGGLDVVMDRCTAIEIARLHRRGLSRNPL